MAIIPPSNNKMHTSKALLAFIFIILVPQTHAVDFKKHCKNVVSPPMAMDKVTGKSHPSSFGDPMLLEPTGGEVPTYELQMFDINNKQQEAAAQHELKIVSRLSKKLPEQIQPILFCQLMTYRDGTPHTLIFGRNPIPLTLKSDLINQKNAKAGINIRGIFYSKIAKLVSDVNAEKVAHCNLKPVAFATDSSKFSLLKLTRFRFAVNADKETCTGNSKNFKPYDVNNVECKSPEMVLKADAWNLALTILLLEDQKNTADLFLLAKATEKNVFGCFFKPENVEECQISIQKYIKSVLNKRFAVEKGERELYNKLGKLLVSAFVGCKERISTAEMYAGLLDIAFPTKTPTDPADQNLMKTFANVHPNALLPPKNLDLHPNMAGTLGYNKPKALYQKDAGKPVGNTKKI